jgi:dienelactone hydrolase
MIGLLRLSLAIGSALVVTGLLVIALSLLFMPRRPSPTGTQAVGRMEVVLRVNGQALPITLWYPATGSPGRIIVDAPLHAPAPAPVILYSPGWGGARRQSSIQAENLASHGFVIVGCDDVASGTADDSDDALIEMNSDAALKAMIERGDRHVRRQAGRLLDVLRALENGEVSAVAGRLDLARVGALGYSVGGPSVVQASLMDPRIVAVMNIDGALVGAPADQIGPQGYFLLSSHEAFPTDAELGSSDPVVRNNAYLSAVDIPRNKRRIERPGNYWAAVAPADHGDLADSLFSLRTDRLLRPNSLRSAMNQFIEQAEVAYFRHALLGDNRTLATLVGNDTRNVRWISSTSPTP